MSAVTPKGNSWALGLFVHSDVDDSDLSVYEFRVYAHLCRRAGDERRVWEGQKKIAAACQMGRTKVQATLYSLQEKGWLQLVERRREDDSRTTNDIILLGPPAHHTGTPARITGTPRPPREQAPPATRAAEVNPGEVNPREVTPPTPQGEREEVVLPSWLPEEAWGDFLAHRKALKAPVNALSGKRLIATLEKLRAEGHDPVEVIDQSIATGKWTGLFAVKGSARGGGAGRPQTTEDADARAQSRAADVYRFITGGDL